MTFILLKFLVSWLWWLVLMDGIACCSQFFTGRTSKFCVRANRRSAPKAEIGNAIISATQRQKQQSVVVFHRASLIVSHLFILTAYWAERMRHPSPDSDVEKSANI